MAIVECIFSVSRDFFTPFHLGLAIQLYHDFGSRQLIDTLYFHGFCASYGEIRRYLTSIAHHEIEKITGGVYVPDGIIPIQEGGGLIQEGADNIDINIETIDGKDTFHSMALSVFQICHYSVEPTTNKTKIRRSEERSVQMTDEASSLTSCLLFVKPKTRETPRRPTLGSS